MRAPWARATTTGATATPRATYAARASRMRSVSVRCPTAMAAYEATGPPGRPQGPRGPNRRARFAPGRPLSRRLRVAIILRIEEGGTMASRIDLNADMGESYGRWTLGDDEALMPLLTS